MSQAPAATEAEASLPTRKSSSRGDLLGWVVTCGGVVVLLIGSLPVLVVAIPLGLVVVLLSVIVLSRGKVSGDAAVGYGLAGLVTTLVGLVVALTLAFTPIPAEFARNLDIYFGSNGLGGMPATTTSNPAPQHETTRRAPPGQSPVLLQPVNVHASASANLSQDSSGKPVTFYATNVIDGDLSTPWGVEGRGIGQTITFVFNGPVRLTAVGMVPGYAKVDGASGLNQFVQNRRVTKARYLFTDGSSLDISFSDDAVMQGAQVDVETTAVEIQVLSTSTSAKRDFTAVSEVAFQGRVAG